MKKVLDNTAKPCDNTDAGGGGCATSLRRDVATYAASREYTREEYERLKAEWFRLYGRKTPEEIELERYAENCPKRESFGLQITITYTVDDGFHDTQPCSIRVQGYASHAPYCMDETYAVGTSPDVAASGIVAAWWRRVSERRRAEHDRRRAAK